MWLAGKTPWTSTTSECDSLISSSDVNIVDEYAPPITTESTESNERNPNTLHSHENMADVVLPRILSADALPKGEGIHSQQQGQILPMLCS